jgi:rubrerythrin
MSNNFSGLEMLKIAMLMEDEGSRFYSEGAKNAAGEVRDFLLASAKQELAHKAAFSKMYDELSSGKGEAYEYLFEPEVASYLRSLIENQVFDNGGESNRDAFKDMKAAAAESARAEQRTVDVYQKMYEGITDPEARAVMKKIIDEEIAHVAYFKSLI